MLALQTRYNPNLIKAIKRIQGVGWDPTAKVWVFPSEQRGQVEEVLQQMGLPYQVAPMYREMFVSRTEGLLPYQVVDACKAAELGYFSFNYEMGLGKTGACLETLKLIGAENVLVICPALVRENRVWPREAEKWGFEGELTVTSYEMVGKLPAAKWDAIVLDESHYCKSPNAVRTKKLLALSRDNPVAAKYILSGTPLAQYPKDIWAQMEFLRPGSFSTWWKFAFEYCNVVETTYGKSVEGVRHADDLRRRLNTFSSRVTRAAVAHLLPPVQSISREFDTVVQKLQWLKELWAKMDGAPLLVFCFRRATARELAKELGGLSCTGEQTHTKRLALAQEAAVTGVPLVATMDSMGIGIDLTAFSLVVLFEMAPKLSVDQQALGRVCRLSGDQPVQIYFPTVRHSDEEIFAVHLMGRIAEMAKVVDSTEAANLIETGLGQSDETFLRDALAAATVRLMEVDEYGL